MSLEPTPFDPMEQFGSVQFGSFSINALSAIAFSLMPGCAIATSIRFSASPLPPVRA